MSTIININGKQINDVDTSSLGSSEKTLASAAAVRSYVNSVVDGIEAGEGSVMPGYINILDPVYGAVLNNSGAASANVAAINAAKAALAQGQILYCPGGGTLYINDTIEFIVSSVSDKRYQGIFNCRVAPTDTSKDAFLIQGGYRQSLFVYEIVGANPYADTEAEYLAYGAGSGIKIRNAANARVGFGQITRFYNGIYLVGESSNGTQYTTVEGVVAGGGKIYECYRQIHMYRGSGASWVNENTFRNIQLGHGTSGSFGQGGWIGLSMQSAGSSAANLESNDFWYVSMEGLEHGAIIDFGSSTNFHDCRIEGLAVRYPLDISPSSAQNTHFFGGAPTIIDWFTEGRGGRLTKITSGQIWGEVGNTQSSSTSNTIGTGSKTFTIATGLSTFQPGNYAKAYYDANNAMFGTVTSYNSGTGELVLNIASVKGSGTYTAWSLKTRSGQQGYMGTELHTLPASPTLTGINNQDGKPVIKGAAYPGFTNANNMYSTDDLIQQYDIAERPLVQDGLRIFDGEIRYGAYAKRRTTITTQTSVSLPPMIGWIEFGPTVGNVTATLNSGDLTTNDFHSFYVEIKNTTYTLTINSSSGNIASSNFPSTGLYLVCFRNGGFYVGKIA